MSDIPDDLLPDDPQRIGEVGDHATVIDGTVFPGEAREADGEQGDCDWCDKHTYVYLGLDVETHEAKRMCILCRARYADSPADNSE
jgi:hypothetical protein